MKKTISSTAIVVVLLLTYLFLLTSCGFDITTINNLSEKDTLIVELYKSKFDPKHFQIWEEIICIEEGPKILYHSLIAENIEAILYKSVDTLELKHNLDCNRYQQKNQIDGIWTQNEAEILYYRREVIKLKVHILPKNNLPIGHSSFINNSEATLDWDTVVIYRNNMANLKIFANSLKDNITNTRSIGYCGGRENSYYIDIK